MGSIQKMGGKVESIAIERDELVKVVVELEARLEELESKLNKSKPEAAKEREVSKELEKELLVYKEEA